MRQQDYEDTFANGGAQALQVVARGACKLHFPDCRSRLWRWRRRRVLFFLRRIVWDGPHNGLHQLGQFRHGDRSVGNEKLMVDG
jgi:hypothetical protein